MTLDSEMVDAMRGLAVPPVVMGEGRADAWFDGFWDFFVAERARLASEPSAWVSGTSWLLLHWRCEARAREAGLDLFVEDKDRRPNALAPAPVVTIVVGTGAPVTRAPLAPRPLDAERERILGTQGFDVAVGYWGVHARRPPGPPLPTATLAAMVAAARELVRG